MFTSFRCFGNAQIPKIDQSIIELRYLEDVKIHCAISFYVLLFLRRPENGNWKGRLHSAAQRNEREHRGRKEVGCNYHLLWPAAALDLSFRLSCLISTSALRHRFLAARGLGN